ncbi:MAG: protein BatD [Opitutus sp.]|nr:protein BatD [Opitutus sp.]
MRRFVSMFAKLRQAGARSRHASDAVGGGSSPRELPSSPPRPRRVWTPSPHGSIQTTPLLLFAALLAALVAGTTLRAQSVRWDPPSGQLGYNQVSELSLVFEECEPDGQPQLPAVAGLVFGRPSQRSETSMVNFSVTRKFSLVYPVRPGKRASITIPGFTVQTDKGALRVAPATYSVGDATVGNSGLSVDDVASVTLAVPKTTLWAGEVFPVTYTLSVIKRYFHSPATLVEWPSAPLVTEEWSKPEPAEAMIRGERRIVATQSTRAYAKTPGSLSLKPAQQLVNLVVGSTGFGLFSTPAVEQRVLATQPLDLTIRPLPPGPADFSGAVGKFALVSKVVPTAPAVGEPVTWTLELTGTGNWPDFGGLPQREVSSDFSVVQPKSKRTMKDGALFEGTLIEDVVLVPTKPGRYTLPPVRFTYFDTASGTYRTIATETVTVNVGPGAPAPAQPQPTGPVQFSLNPQGAPVATPTPALPEAVPPVPPENLPRDPLTESARGFVPLPIDRLVVLCLLSSVLAPLLLWLVLAAIRSRALDPQRRRREAHAALAKILTELRSGGSQPPTLHSQLQAWQQHAAALWEIPHAAPATPLVHGCVSAHSKDAASAWTTLWNEADRAQHGRDGRLPQDWVLRAEGALQAVKVPGWPVFSLFTPRHLLPFLFALSVAFAPAVARADAAEDYKRANYAAAQAAWQKAVAADPADWAARHNLGLVLAQQDRWPEAAAQWTSAFLLDARSELARWDLALGLQRSGMAPPELVEFSRGEGRYAFAREASPGEWQLVLVGAALLIAVALGLLLFRGYRRAGAWTRPVALTIVIIAILAAAAATFALNTYGQLAHPDAVLVVRASTLRSIPTDADTQKITALSAGSIAVVDKTFLGWSRLNFAGGQTGWARSEDLAKLYR